jgi:hypothetical protein
VVRHNDEFSAFLCGFGVCLLLFLFFAPTYEDFRKEAVEHNAAQFVIVDPATGATEFRWNDEVTTGTMKIDQVRQWKGKR